MNRSITFTDLYNSLKFTAAMTVLFAASFLVTSICILSYIKSSQEKELVEYVEEIKDLYVEDGYESVLHEFDLEEQPIWDRVESIERLVDHEFIFALVDRGVLLVGSKLEFSSNTEPEWSSFDLQSEHDFQLLTLSIALTEDVSLSIAQPLSYEYMFSKELLWRASLIGVVLITLILFFIRLLFNYRRRLEIQTLMAQLDEVSRSPDSVRLRCEVNDSALRDLTLSINLMLDKVSKLHGTTKTMSVGIAHDLKTPLSRVANRLQSMAQDVGDDIAITSHISHATKDLHSVISTFNNLVRLNSIESGKHKQNFQLINLSELINDLALSYEPVFEDSGRLLSHSTVDCVSCFGDKDLLSQLLCNLLENALEYSNEGSRVWIRLQSHTNGALLQVGDNGLGIDKEDQPYIFDRFYRADLGRTKPGNGLGLSIVKAICDVHGASLVLLPDQSGAVFNIEVPISNQ
ncbi:hypothetical protein N473_24545 [Pseudoalteromonas luteoviolacea CPMOR-1]|uniref:histidine kinase n=2 Tax=Pseudoalteromonas luteoviolacea TaxID=43657 RepID=A0A167IW57_9GAMM|nr:hypothetical protein N473_24545 [Pseudoalteromonas luteoviolacea CPMOR-1]